MLSLSYPASVYLCNTSYHILQRSTSERAKLSSLDQCFPTGVLRHTSTGLSPSACLAACVALTSRGCNVPHIGTRGAASELPPTSHRRSLRPAYWAVAGGRPAHARGFRAFGIPFTPSSSRVLESAGSGSARPALSLVGIALAKAVIWEMKTCKASNQFNLKYVYA